MKEQRKEMGKAEVVVVMVGGGGGEYFIIREYHTINTKAGYDPGQHDYPICPRGTRLSQVHGHRYYKPVCASINNDTMKSTQRVHDGLLLTRLRLNTG